MGETELVFVDTNIFLEVALEDAKNDQCELFLRRLARQEISAITSDFVLYSCLIQIERRYKNPKVIRDFFLSINELKGLTIVRPSFKEMYGAVAVAEKYKLDFDDSFVVACMILNGVTTLISLDKDFDRVKEIIRKEP